MDKRYLIPITVLLASACFFWIDLPIKIRAVNPAVNYLVYSIFCFLVPISIATLGYLISRKWLRIFVFVIAVLVAVPVGILGALSVDEAIRINALGYDPSLEYLKEISDGEYQFRLYRTNCGATCAYGLDLRKEKDTSLGLKFVHNVWSEYGVDAAEDAELSISNGVVRVKYDGTEAEVSQ